MRFVAETLIPEVVDRTGASHQVGELAQRPAVEVVVVRSKTGDGGGITDAYTGPRTHKDVVLEFHRAVSPRDEIYNGVFVPNHRVVVNISFRCRRRAAP